MEKIRVYELAKELNTTSKRLMEKLEEINVHVKNHMSLLEDHELESLYKHIGLRHDDPKRTDAEDKKAAPPVQQKAQQKDTKKDAPRIIRTTEVVIDSRNEAKETVVSGWTDPRKKDQRPADRNQKHDFFRVSDSNSGLRAGYERAQKPAFNNKPPVRNDKIQQREQPKEQPKAPEARHEPAVAATKETRPVPKPEAVIEQVKPVQETVTKPAENIAEPAAPKAEMPKAEVTAEIQTPKPAEQTQQVQKEATPVPREQQRPASDRPVGDRPFRSNDNRPTGDRPQNRPYDNRPYDNRPAGDRPQQRPYDNRPSGDRPFRSNDNRPTGDRPQNRPYDNRPYENRPAGDRPQQRPYDNRPSGDRPAGDRPFRPYDRPAGDRPQGQRPPYDPNRRPYDNRPAGDRPAGDRPFRPYDRPAGDRPQGQRPPYDPNRRPPQQGGQRFPQGGQRPGRPLDIPMPELSAAQKEEMLSQRGESRREFSSKDNDKDNKRELKREIPKTQPQAKSGSMRKIKPPVLGEKKGISEVLSEDFILEEFYDDSGVKKTRRVAGRKRDGRDRSNIPPRAVLTSVTLPESITVKDLAETLKKTSTEVIKKLMVLGLMATLNQEIDFDTATLVAGEFGVATEKAVVVNEEDILFDETEEADENLDPRPPVVVVMGHVDHGKTSLLDAIRETNVIDTEAGGITQHIGAYMVKINNRKITFLDTPGHEAFTAMRARGAQVTDIAILVVAADDGVMPQTVEAINHAKAAKVAIIVAINKIDKPGANPERVKQELTEHGLVVEEWGGDVIAVPVSAKKRENIDQLLEMVLLTADVLELKSNPNKQAKGTIIEAKLDKNRGPIATLLVQRGTLNVGDSLVTGTTVGRIRAMLDDKGNNIKSAGPSTPVEITGMPEVPEAGEIFYAITDERVARQLAEKRKAKQREQTLKASARVSLDDLFNQIKEGKVKDLNIIVKADVQGSVEAVKQSLVKLSNDEVRVNVIHDGVGAITESDVKLAEVSNAIIIGFNVRPGSNVADVAKTAGVDLRLYRIIYNAIEDIQAAMKGMLEPTFKEVVLGHAEIRQIFKVSGIGTIAGCYMTDGKVTRNSDIRVVRNGIVIHEGKLASLKRFKDDAKEVAQGFECGMSVERFNDIKEGDIIESYTMEEVVRT